VTLENPLSHRDRALGGILARWLEDVWTDVRFAVRQCRKQPTFTATAVFVLALGLCASVAIFAFVNAALLKPLPYRDPAKLVGIYERIPFCERCNLSYPDYFDWKRLNHTLASLDVYTNQGFSLASPGGAERVPGARVSDGFFRTLGVSPRLGRDFRDGENQPSAPRVVILSDSSWQSRYGGRHDVLGHTVTFDGDTYTIVGVLPPDFHFAPVGTAEFWTTIHTPTACEQRRSCHNLYGVGRLKDVSIDAASADFALVANQLESQYPDSNRGQGSNVVPLTDVVVGRIQSVLIALLAGSALLLLIAAVNVSSLLLVRSEGRRREIAIRSGLGASPARLAAQFVTEALFLASMGTACGLMAASWLATLLTRLIPQNLLNGMPYLAGLGLHGREWLFAGVLALLTAILLSATPLLRLSLSKPSAGLGEPMRGHSGSAWKRLGAHLVIVELAIAVVLLASAVLVGKSLYRLLRVDLGMRPDHVATVSIGAPRTEYSTDDQFIALNRDLLTRIASIPGVQSVSTSSVLPIDGGNTRLLRFADRPFNGERIEVVQRSVTPAYFTTLGARLRTGRYFTESDDVTKPSVAIVDRGFVEKYFPTKRPIGQQFLYRTGTQQPITIVGVIDDIKEGPIDSTSWPAAYFPFKQTPSGYFVVAARCTQDERAFLPTLQSTIHQFDPGLTTSNLRTMSDQVNNSPAAYLRRSAAILGGAFALAALILGVVGLYGVIANSVSQRTREFGIRLALGAQRSRVYRMILTEAATLVGIGTAIGLVSSLGAARLLQSLLYGIKPSDAPTYVTVAAILGACALVASMVPARRAAAVNPVEALRAD
jgi:predicted permease